MRQSIILFVTLAVTPVAGLTTTASGQTPNHSGAVVTAPSPSTSPPVALPVNPLPLTPTLGGIPAAPMPKQTPAPVAAPDAPPRR